MMELKYGTLVRVCNPMNNEEIVVVEEEGYLWTYIQWVRHSEVIGEGLHLCKSLATGCEHYWYTHEFEVADGD